MTIFEVCCHVMLPMDLTTLVLLAQHRDVCTGRICRTFSSTGKQTFIKVCTIRLRSFEMLRCFLDLYSTRARFAAKPTCIWQAITLENVETHMKAHLCFLDSFLA